MFMRRKISFSLRTLYPGLRRKFRRDLLRSYASSTPPPTGGNNGGSRLNLVCPCVAKAPMEFTTYPKPRGGSSSSSSKSTNSTNNKGPVIRCTKCERYFEAKVRLVDGNAQQLWNAPTSASSGEKRKGRTGGHLNQAASKVHDHESEHASEMLDFSPREVFDRLCDHVVGQTQVKKVLSVGVRTLNLSLIFITLNTNTYRYTTTSNACVRISSSRKWRKELERKCINTTS
jgi:hypothetical protein